MVVRKCKYMKRKIYSSIKCFVTLLSLIIVNSTCLKASHLPGGDIEYQCVGPNQYILKATFFVKCPSSLGTTININRTNTCGLTNTAIPLTCYVCKQEVSQLCPQDLPNSKCNGGTLPGVYMYKYQSQVVTIPPCDSWTFSYSLCCRNTTVNVTGTPTFYVETKMYSQTEPCNTTPSWTAQPIPYYCVNQPVTHNWGIVEPDGHTMIFQLVPGKSAAGTNIPYNGGYSGAAPIPGITINPSTGQINFTATIVGDYVIAVKVTEYNNLNQIVSEQTHDVQFTIINCANSLPLPPQNGITNVTGGGVLTPPNKITLCEGSATCFDIVFSDPNQNQVLTLTSQVTNILVGSTFTVNGTNPATATICWQAPPGSQGTYTFSVQAKDGACPIEGITSFGVELIVIPGIIVNLGPDQNLNCGQTFTINPAISGGSGNYNYLWSNGSTNPAITVGPGTYWLEVTDQNGTTCIGVDTIVINGNPGIIADFNFTNVCDGFPMTLTDASNNLSGTITNWDWDIYNNNSIDYITQNANHIFPGPGTYDVQLIVTNSAGCVDSIIKQVTVYPNPVANYSAVGACDGFPVTLTDLSSGGVNNWQWDVDNNGVVDYTSQNTTHIYPNSGTFIIKLVVGNANGCKDSVTQTVNVTALPMVNFSAPSVCIGSITPFQDVTTPNPTSWFWNFGDGNNSTLQNPTHTYSNPGVYNVTLSSSANGCIDSITKQVVVNPKPIPSFTYNLACPTQQTVFNNTSTILSGTISSWAWSFPGATPPGSTAQNPTTTYSSGGNYVVTLTATSDSGCVDSVSQQIVIPYTPLANFSATTVCVGGQTCFTDLSNVQNGNITGWQWVFGDGSPVDNAQNPCHTYANAGVYNVTLVVTSNDGCASSHQLQVTVHSLPIAAFSTNDVCNNIAAIFNDQSQNVASYNWNFGDGNTSTSQNPSHFYVNPGTYSVKLVVTSAGGCLDSITKQITIYPMPIANFNVINACDGNAIIFTDASTGNITNWNWNFGDGVGSSTSQNDSYLYASSGVYNVKLLIVSSDGCIDSIVKQATVYALPIVDFSPIDVCLGTPSVFTDLSQAPGSTISQWYWNFGDNTSSSSSSPTHTYNQEGTYNVTLTVTTNNGCVGTATKIITVHPNPIVDFAISDSANCSPLCVNFFDLSTISGNGSISQWEWSFGTGNASSLQNPSNCFTATGLSPVQYSISLTTTSNYGCKSSLTKNNLLTVYPMPKADFEANPWESDVFSSKIRFTDLSYGANTWNWSFGDGATSNIQHPTHIFSDSGTYTVTLNIISKYGCVDAITKTIRINPDFAVFIPNAFTPDADGINDTFGAKGYGINEYSMLIFDRWGELIFESYRYGNNWDGKQKGKEVEVGVYVYKIILKDINMKSHQFIGNVNVIR
ncbi:MAG: PKD domain-containing protein [Bacteroidetes bacterium]|nr:PKD domain-containing protein [Bacteroidota bacterium]